MVFARLSPEALAAELTLIDIIMIYFGLIQSMDRFTANDTKASSVPRVFLAFPFKFGKKMPKAGAKRAIFASQRGSVGDFLGLKAQLIDDDVLGTGDNFPDADAFCEA